MNMANEEQIKNIERQIEDMNEMLLGALSQLRFIKNALMVVVGFVVAWLLVNAYDLFFG